MTHRSPARQILLADADAFYVSVARLIDPEGAGRAKYLIVGGSPKERGVVTSASYEARKFGVHSAMPTARALRLCPQATVVGVPRTECVRKSRAIRDILNRYTPLVEAASIDEFYLDMTGTEQLYREPLDVTAARIRRHVVRETGVSLSIGGGTGKLIAKLAAKRAKPSRDAGGVCLVPPGRELAFMRTHQLGEIPQIGPKLQERLGRLGLKSVAEALALDRAQLVSLLGERSGNWLYRRVRGLDSSRVNPRFPAKSLSHEETFARDITNDAELERKLLRLATHVAADLRKRHLAARTVSVKVKYGDFTVRQANSTTAEPVATDRPIIDTSRNLLRRVRRARHGPIRLLGVAVSQLLPSAQVVRQLSLFNTGESLESARDRSLASMVDRINERFGRRGIVRGSTVRPDRR